VSREAAENGDLPQYVGMEPLGGLGTRLGEEGLDGDLLPVPSVGGGVHEPVRSAAEEDVVQQVAVPEEHVGSAATLTGEGFDVWRGSAMRSDALTVSWAGGPDGPRAGRGGARKATSIGLAMALGGAWLVALGALALSGA